MASIAKYKAALRTAIRRSAHQQEVNFLNITAMMDMMTIILVFLLKSMSSSSANMPPSNELALPASLAKCLRCEVEQVKPDGSKVTAHVDCTSLPKFTPEQISKLPHVLEECEPSDDGIEVVVSRDKILVDNALIDDLVVPSCFNNPNEAPDSNKPFKLMFCKGDSRSGFAPKFKARGIQSDPEITALRERVRSRVPVAEEISRHKPKNDGKAKVEARIFFDRYTSYQVMTEIMFSLGLEKVAKFHFIMLKSE